MKVESLGRGWKFYRNASSIDELPSLTSVAVNIPHTWNNLDGQDGGNDYYRGTCYYEKVIDLLRRDDRDYYLEFRGVNSIAHVYLNNVLVGEHKGGYSTFRCNITPYVRSGENTLVVAVDNSDNDEVYPKVADFTFFGGIYRDVYCIEVTRSRFDLDYYGGEGVMITPSVKKGGKALVTVESFITSPLDGQYIDIDIIFDGKVVASKSTSVFDSRVDFDIDKPILWDGVKSPNLYTAHLTLRDDSGELDSRSIDFGIRSFQVDKDGFYLNGRKYDLHGVSRHQDRENMGNAITKAEHEEDMALIKEVGANTIRLAHYQHDQYFYDLCDRNGMVVWAEIPYISVHLQDGNDNALSQMRELVIQNYNHPSIMFWGISNEITIGGESESQLALHRELNDLVHSLDSTRLTTMANVTMCDTKSPLLKVPDIFSYNHYFGWYIGDVEMNAKWIDDFRQEFPNTPIGISEYGAEAILTWHNSHPKMGDYSEEYQAYYHENMLRIFKDRPYLWSTYVWNMFDFGVDARDEGGVKGRNNKGLVTYDRKTKKDSFYLYKAYWSDEPFIHICSKRYKKRCEKDTIVKVYTNQDKVDLYIDNRLYESKSGAYVYSFSVPLSLLGSNIKVVSGSLRDSVRLRRVLKEEDEYILKEASENVTNWFEVDGVKYEFHYIDGRYSIKDTLSDIMKNEEGRALIEMMLTKALGSSDPSMDKEKFLSSTMKLVGNMSLERVAKFAGKKVTNEMLYDINERLNQIEK